MNEVSLGPLSGLKHVTDATTVSGAILPYVLTDHKTVQIQICMSASASSSSFASFSLPFPQTKQTKYKHVCGCASVFVAGKEFSNIELAKAQQNLEHYITD